MSIFIEPTATVSQAWVNTLRTVTEAGGRAVNVITTVLEPGSEESSVRTTLDEILEPGYRNKTKIQTVDTVANTIFPSGLYADPGLDWSPDLNAADAERIDAAAEQLFDAYLLVLPKLTRVHANAHGTYFGRMVSWPGKSTGGFNQLEHRIHYLRLARRDGKSAQNASDIAIGGEGEYPTELIDLGLQVYATEDDRPQGFPCLVHVDLTLHDGRLNMVAVYRHQYLLTKAYGNLLGLSRLLQFLAQQTGYEVGELVVHATLADNEKKNYGGKRGVLEILDSLAAPESLGAE